MVRAIIDKLLVKPSLNPRMFLLRTLLWLPLLFLTWYLLSSWLIRPALELAKFLLPLGLPHLIENITIEQHYLFINTYLGADSRTELPQGFARFASSFFTTGQHYPFLFTFPLDSLKYAYGLPILTALVLASPITAKHKLVTFCLGFLLVSLIVVWGLYFNTANLLALNLKPELTTQAKVLWPLLNESYMQTLIAFGYRIGFLIFPVVLPIMLWAQLNPQIIHQLIHSSTFSTRKQE